MPAPPGRARESCRLADLRARINRAVLSSSDKMGTGLSGGVTISMPSVGALSSSPSLRAGGHRAGESAVRDLRPGRDQASSVAGFLAAGKLA